MKEGDYKRMPPRKKTQAQTQKEEEEKYFQMLNFASNSVVNKPFISNQSTSLGMKMSKAQLKRLLQNPVQNYAMLQQISELLTTLNGIYARIVYMFSSILTLDHFIYPVVSSDKFAKQDNLMNSYEECALQLDKMNIKYYLPLFLKEIVKKGEVFVYKLEDTKGIIYQRIPNKFCRLSSITDGVYGYEIDMSLFTEKTIMYFPKEFQDMYTVVNTKGGNTENLAPFQNPTSGESKWCQVSDKGIAFTTNPEGAHAFPPLSFLFTDILDIDNAKDLKKEVDRLDNAKMIHNQIECDSETGLPTMDLELAKKYNESIKSNISEGIFSVTNPFKTQVLNLQSGQQRVVNMVEEAVDQMFADAGVSDMLLGNKKASGEALKMSVKTDVALLFSFILPMFSNYINSELRKVNSVYRWKVKMLETTIFDRTEQLKQIISCMPLGASRFMYMALQGLTPLESLNTLKFEQMINIDSLLVPKMNSHVMSTGGEAGRETTDNPTASTEAWRENQ